MGRLRDRRGEKLSVEERRTIDEEGTQTVREMVVLSKTDEEERREGRVIDGERRQTWRETGNGRGGEMDWSEYRYNIGDRRKGEMVIDR